jgi:hypothetical protein
MGGHGGGGGRGGGGRSGGKGTFAPTDVSTATVSRNKLEAERQKIISNYPTHGSESEKAANRAARTTIESKINEVNSRIEESMKTYTKEVRGWVRLDISERLAGRGGAPTSELARIRGKK